MGDIDIQVKWDAKQFTDQLEGAATKMLSSLASAINKSARTARREDIKIIAQDIGRPASEFRDATPVIRRASPGNLTATWTVKKKKVGVLGTGTFTPVMSALRGSFSGSTFRLLGRGIIGAQHSQSVYHAKQGKRRQRRSRIAVYSDRQESERRSCGHGRNAADGYVAA